VDFAQRIHYPAQGRKCGFLEIRRPFKESVRKERKKATAHAFGMGLPRGKQSKTYTERQRVLSKLYDRRFFCNRNTNREIQEIRMQ